MKRVQVSVIGGGPAGLNAAYFSAKSGAETILFDERDQLGGPPPLLGAEVRHVKTEELGAVLKPKSVVLGLFEGNVLSVVEETSSYEVEADQVILATGSTDLPCPFPGATLPGVFTSGAVEVMMFQWGILPGRRFVLVSDQVDLTDLTWGIERFGGEIVAWVDPKDASRMKVFGDRDVQTVEIDDKHIDADVVVLDTGRQPDIELALMAGCEIGFNEKLGGFVPIRDGYLRTSVASILVAGDAGGVCGTGTALSEGHLAGVSAAHALGLVDEETLEDAYRSRLGIPGNREVARKRLTPVHVQV